MVNYVNGKKIVDYESIFEEEDGKVLRNEFIDRSKVVRDRIVEVESTKLKALPNSKVKKSRGRRRRGVCFNNE